ncbi:MAG: recombination protein RecR [Ignavibacteriae bacterium]|nr:recombination protein RecR [Ignavibacteriota bacterium]
MYTAESIEQLVEEFSSLPGIGRKSAHRLAMHILKLPKPDVVKIAEALVNVKERINYCNICWNFTEENPCRICSNHNRNRSLICVVEDPNDVIAIEKTHEYKGLYHVLGDALSPLDGIGPEDLKIKELLHRIEGSVQEIILAMNASIEGEATTIYLSRLLKPLGMKITRLARGIPVGSDLEFTDEATLARALQSRTEV